MLRESGLLANLKKSTWHNIQPLSIYGDPEYPLSIHLQAPFSRQNLTPNQVNHNKAMSHTQVSVEWLFNKIETYFKFVSLKSQMKVGLNVVGKICCVYMPYFKMQEHVYVGIKFLRFPTRPSPVRRLLTIIGRKLCFTVHSLNLTCFAFYIIMYKRKKLYVSA